jgi:hypothetical protein
MKHGDLPRVSLSPNKTGHMEYRWLVGVRPPLRSELKLHSSAGPLRRPRSALRSPIWALPSSQRVFKHTPSFFFSTTLPGFLHTPCSANTKLQDANHANASKVACGCAEQKKTADGWLSQENLSAERIPSGAVTPSCSTVLPPEGMHCTAHGRPS